MDKYVVVKVHRVTGVATTVATYHDKYYDGAAAEAAHHTVQVQSAYLPEYIWQVFGINPSQ